MKKFYVLIIGSLLSIPSLAQTHLVLSEISLAPDAGEFIEIYNPTSTTISLDNYYLADNAEYALLPSGTTNVSSSDLIVQFPSGFSIAPNQVITIAANNAGFNTSFGINADFEVGPTDANVPDMYLTDIGSTPTLTNAGEGIILFYWDGISDLVSDVDMMNAGVPLIANQIAPKTGIAVDGPDANTTPTSYLNDAVTIPVQSSTPSIGLSTKRILLEGGNEVHSGGNGITGDDETTENITITWDATFIASTPGISDVITGIASVNDFAFSVYPNPSSNYFMISFPDISKLKSNEMKICDVVGKLIYSQQLSETSTLINHQFKSGVYLLTISNDENIHTSRLVIK